MDSKNNEMDLIQELEAFRHTKIERLIEEEISRTPPSLFKTRQQQAQEIRSRHIDNLKKEILNSRETGQEIIECADIGIKLPENYSEMIDTHIASMRSIQEELDSGREIAPEIPLLQKKLNISEASMLKIYEKTYELYEQKNLEKATSYCLFAINLNPLASAFWLMLGCCHEQLKQLEQASLAFSMAATLEPDNWKAHVHVVRILFKQDKQAEAETYATEALSALNQSSDEQSLQSLKKYLNELKIKI